MCSINEMVANFTFHYYEYERLIIIDRQECLGKFELGGPVIMQKIYYFIPDVLRIFRSCPLWRKLFLPTAPPQCRVKTVAPPHKKLQMGPFDIYKRVASFALFRLGY